MADAAVDAECVCRFRHCLALLPCGDERWDGHHHRNMKTRIMIFGHYPGECTGYATRKKDGNLIGCYHKYTAAFHLSNIYTRSWTAVNKK